MDANTTPEAADPSAPSARRWRAVLPAALVGTVLLGLRLARLVAAHHLPDADEIHTLLGARLVLAGAPLSAELGTITPYEGGSWLMAWPVSWAMRLGFGGVEASAWAAVSVALLTVLLGSAWLGRHAGWWAALALGPLVALTSPQFGFYAIRAWGNLAEALLALPILAFVLAFWVDRGRALAWTPALGAALGAAIVLSYFHMVTALAFVVVQGLDGRSGLLRRRAVETAAVAAVAGFVFVCWHAGSTVGLGWPTIRDGEGLHGALLPLLLPRLDLVLGGLPDAWYGHFLGFGPRQLLAGAGLSALAAAAAVAVWRRGGPLRSAVILCALCVPATSVGFWLAEPPEAWRYYLPLLALAVTLIAAWDPRASLAGLALGLLLWWPSVPAPGSVSPDVGHLRLGAFGLSQPGAAPHSKFLALLGEVEPWHRTAFAFGYGLDLGRRGALGDLHRELEGDVAEELLFGVGFGLASDGVLGPPEASAVARVRALDARRSLLEGLGAGFQIAAETGRTTSLAGLQAADLADFEWEHVGRGVAHVQRGDPLAPDGVPGAAARQAWTLGAASEGHPVRTFRVRVRTDAAPVVWGGR
jgi:hypothetical protein